MQPAREPVEGSGELPDPGRAGSLDEFVTLLRRLKVWAGDPSYGSIKDRVNATRVVAGRPVTGVAAKSTVADCFRSGRRRLDTDLVLAVVEVLHPDAGYVGQWRQALRVVVDGVSAALQVRVQDDLPQDVPGFTGRGDELDLIRRAAQGGQRVVMISGMAGVGKTRLAVHAGRLLAGVQPFDRVLFVNLRGFHDDPAQPPADPAACLDAFLRLLGAPDQRLPRDLPSRVAAYRDCLAGLRVLVVLDNAADTDQIAALVADSPGCLTLVTSRRQLTGLPGTTHVGVDLFSPPDAERFLGGAAQDVPVGPDSEALARIARRCGYLPLALGLVAGHIRGVSGWTLTDHADRLDKRHHERRLDTAVEIAFDVSYRHLPAAEQQLLRLLALHPGQDFDAYAAAALTGIEPAAALRRLRRLELDNLLQRLSPDRFTFHDLVRAYATSRVGDDEAPSAQRSALTRLFDHYLAGAAGAREVLFPAETDQRPATDATDTPMPPFVDPDTALAWLNIERPTLVAVAEHTAHGWPTHTTGLSTFLGTYLLGGHYTDALAIHGHARLAAQMTGDLTAQTRAVHRLGNAYLRLGRHELAADHFRQALQLLRQTGDRAGLVRALNNLGVLEFRLGRAQSAVINYEQALALCRETGDVFSEAKILGNLGDAEELQGRNQQAAIYLKQALILSRQTGDRTGEATRLNSMGTVETKLGQYGPAGNHFDQAVDLFRQIGDRTGEAYTLDSIGTLHNRRGQSGKATEYHQRALDFSRESSDRDLEVWALIGLGEAARTAGQPADAVAHYTAAHAIAAEIDNNYQQARAHAGLGHAHRTLNDPTHARRHYQQARTLYTDLGLPDADQIKAHLADLAADPVRPRPRRPRPTRSAN
jgi:tetratricopeptide (TPR) repeat protein